MCGRYSITTPVEALREAFRFSGPPINLAPRYNAAPTQDLPIVRLSADGSERQLAVLRWGLVPSWATDPAIGNRLINARAETVAEKPSFRSAFRSRRCLVPADGFYEWRKIGGHKQPYRICRPDGAPFAFAGLWERWASEQATPLETFTILTTEATAELSPIHGRMPVILPTASYDAWLNPNMRRADLTALLTPYPGALDVYAVDTRVNNARNDDPACIAPAAEQPNLP